jgi:hypothetical protein
MWSWFPLLMFLPGSPGKAMLMPLKLWAPTSEPKSRLRGLRELEWTPKCWDLRCVQMTSATEKHPDFDAEKAETFAEQFLTALNCGTCVNG